MRRPSRPATALIKAADKFDLAALEQRLVAERWAQHGGPQILPDGWPDKRPPR